MVEFIGVLQSDFNICKKIKKCSLIFDKLATFEVDFFIGYFASRNKYESAELEWLLEQGIIFLPIWWDDRLFEDNSEYQILEIQRTNILDKNLKSNDKIEKLFQILVRQICIQLQENQDVDVIPVLTNSIPSSRHNAANIGDVVNIVLKTLPIPDDSTDWEQIMDYRKNPESKSKFLSLRNWMNEIPRTNISPIEIIEKIEYLMDDYERHIKLHKMKINKGIFETIIVTGAEIIEDLVKVKWGKLAKSLFVLKNHKIKLLEAEMNAPGKEVAYIIKTKNTFST